MEHKRDLDKKISAVKMMARPRFHYQDILRAVINADVREHDTGPHICLDECTNNHIVKGTIQDLLSRGLTSGSSELWNQVRIGSDGSSVSVMGGLPGDFSFPGLSGGTPLRHASSDDQWVAYLLLAHFATYTTLVLLTENTGTDQFGLRRLLRNSVKPYLSMNHLDRFSLTVLFKKWSTNYPNYCRGVTEIFESGTFKCGYSEVQL